MERTAGLLSDIPQQRRINACRVVTDICYLYNPVVWQLLFCGWDFPLEQVKAIAINCRGAVYVE